MHSVTVKNANKSNISQLSISKIIGFEKKIDCQMINICSIGLK